MTIIFSSPVCHCFGGKLRLPVCVRGVHSLALSRTGWAAPHANNATDTNKSNQELGRKPGFVDKIAPMKCVWLECCVYRVYVCVWGVCVVYVATATRMRIEKRFLSVDETAAAANNTMTIKHTHSGATHTLVETNGETR